MTDWPCALAASLRRAVCPHAAWVRPLPRGHFPRDTCRRPFQSTGQKPGPAAATTDAHLAEEVGKKGKKSWERDQLSRRSLPALCSAPGTGESGFGRRNDETFTAKALSDLVPSSLSRPPHPASCIQSGYIALERRGWEYLCPDPNSCTTRNRSSNMIYWTLSNFAKKR